MLRKFPIYAVIVVLSWVGISSAFADELSTDALAIIESKAAATRGKSLYLSNCQQCHDADGRALANIDVVATDLTDPSQWVFGVEPTNTFNNIKHGAGLSMPAFSDSLSDNDIWHIVAHILNIGPVEKRPSKP